jgi:hypothetical protein
MKMQGAWKITKDHVTPEGEECCRTGKQSHDWKSGDEVGAIRFQTFDDDGILYHEGLLVDDPYCQGQDRVLDYAMNDAGAVTVKVERNGVFVQEIC